MEKDFDTWNNKKKEISERKRIYFYKGEIWFTSIGKNIGDEEDGKNENFERPVLILRKFNNNIFLCVPLTSQKKEGEYYHRLLSFKDSTAILSQIRLLDSKRLLRCLGKVSASELCEVKNKISRLV